jgi:MFS family permease
MKEVNRRKINKFRRRNAKLYPIYKMFSWDLLCFYSIEYLFLTMTKKVNVSDILFLNAFYMASKMLVQIPSVTLCDYLGRKKSIVLGNLILVLYMITLIMAPNIGFIMLANFLCALGYVIKNLSETILLYDSVATRGGDGLYAKLDSKGGSMYYVLDGMASLIAGYLFVINNYLPLFVCLTCLIIGTIISCAFKDVYEVKHDKNKKASDTFKEYGQDLKDTCKFIFNSKRMKAFLLFKMVFYSFIRVIDIYRQDLLVDIGIPEEQFSVIFAMLTFIAAIAVSMREILEKKFKNRTLTFISVTYTLAVISVGIVSRFNNSLVIPFILTMYVILKIATSIWYILEGKYLKNFTNENVRSKITFTYELIGCMSASIVAILAGNLIKFVSIQNAFLLIGLIALIAIILTLDYMRTRFGLSPKEYDKKDIEFSK